MPALCASGENVRPEFLISLPMQTVSVPAVLKNTLLHLQEIVQVNQHQLTMEQVKPQSSIFHKFAKLLGIFRHSLLSDI